MSLAAADLGRGSDGLEWMRKKEKEKGIFLRRKGGRADIYMF